MAYIVRIQTGTGKNRAVMQSIPLPNKERVRGYVKRNPLGNSKTKVKITNTITKKSKILTKFRASIFGKTVLESLKNKR